MLYKFTSTSRCVCVFGGGAFVIVQITFYFLLKTKRKKIQTKYVKI